jgi:hypothetical protein
VAVGSWAAVGASQAARCVSRRPLCIMMAGWQLLPALLSHSVGGAAAAAAAAVVNNCPHGRANVVDFGADPTGHNDSAPHFRAALASCQALYVPAGLYSLRSPEPSGRLPPPPPMTVTMAQLQQRRKRRSSTGASGHYCPTDGRNCEYANCTCPPGDGSPFDMAAHTRHPGCMACHIFAPPPAAFLDWSSIAVGGGWPGRQGGGITGDGAGVTVLQFVYGGANTSHLAAIYWDHVQFLEFRSFSVVALARNGSELGNTKNGHPTLPPAGVGFRGESNVNLELHALQISGFRVGIWGRYTVMASLSSIEISRCGIGVELARSADGAASVASFLTEAAVLTEIYLCNVCSCQEILRRNGRG